MPAECRAPAAMMKVSIIICTRNRADSLRETLASISRCKVPADFDAELIVVDNGSTDRTREVIEAAGLPNMRVRYVQELNAGLCRARNRGLAESDAEIFLFTDDDVRVPTDWIERMCRPIASAGADAVAGGVKLAPHLQRPWLTGFLRILVASTEDVVRPEDVQLVGANMAFSRRVLEKVPAFDPELGAGALGFSEETLFSWQLGRAGFKITANLETTVEHHFDPDRLTRDAFLVIGERMGRSKAYVHYHWSHRELPHPRLVKIWTTAKLNLRRALSMLASGGTKPNPWEVAYISKLHFVRQYGQERLRPHNYERYGFRKIQGEGWDGNISERSGVLAESHDGAGILKSRSKESAWTRLS
jgi:glycosyltransferase involved in cell wall biosynthesis